MPTGTGGGGNQRPPCTICRTGDSGSRRGTGAPSTLSTVTVIAWLSMLLLLLETWISTHKSARRLPRQQAPVGRARRNAGRCRCGFSQLPVFRCCYWTRSVSARRLVVCGQGGDQRGVLRDTLGRCRATMVGGEGRADAGVDECLGLDRGVGSVAGVELMLVPTTRPPRSAPPPSAQIEFSLWWC